MVLVACGGKDYVDDVCSTPGHLLACAAGAHRRCVTSQDRQALYPGLLRMVSAPCILIIQIQSISDIDPLLLTTTTVLYEENNLQTGIALEKTLTPPMKQWKKDSKESKTVPQTIHDHDLRNPLLSIFESSMHGYPVCEAR